MFFSAVSLVPSEFVSTPGSIATFTCVTAAEVEVVDFQWLVSGTLLDELELDNVEPETRLIGNGILIGRLIFTNISADQNMSIILCRALLMSDASIESDTASVLLLQG